MQRQVHFLQDASVVLYGGLHIFGCSWPSAERENYGAFPNIASDKANHPPVDVVLSHLIPYLGPTEHSLAVDLDGTSAVDFHKWRGGSRALTAAAIQHNTPLVCSGHVHWGRGAVYLSNAKSHDKGTWFVNASSTKPGHKRCETLQEACNVAHVTAPVICYYNLQQRRVVHISCPSH